jgi:hypothetical protein
MLTFWFDWWRFYWGRPCPKPESRPMCSLEDLAKALDEYLKSSKEVAERASRNVEDAQRLKAALEDLKERKRQAMQQPG